MVTKYVLKDKEGEYMDYCYDPEVAEMLADWVEKVEGFRPTITERVEESEGLDQ